MSALSLSPQVAPPRHRHLNIAEHIQDIRFGGRIHNTKMERFNGELRDREKIMRSLKKEDTPILTRVACDVQGVGVKHSF